MKLLELEITDTRGIRELLLRPGGDNLVVWGPNGSGKSAVIDAIDFLLTGRMRRLSGEGTGGITLNRHGPHIDSEASNSFVRGLVQFEKDGHHIELIRRLSNPHSLEVSEELNDASKHSLEVASRGQNILTRREILNFVTADPRTRGEQIQALLDLLSVERLRKALGQAEAQAREAWADARAAFQQTRSRLALILGKDDPPPEDVLAFINKCRAELGAAALDEPRMSQLKDGLTAPTEVREAQGSSLEHQSQLLLGHAGDKGLLTARDFQAVSTRAIDDLLSSGQLKDMLRMELVTRGMDLLDESGLCPLCETPWSMDELRRKLRERHLSLEAANKAVGAVTETVNGFRQFVTTSINAVDVLEKAVPESPDIELLLGWQEDLRSLQRSLSEPIEALIQTRWPNAEEIYGRPGLAEAAKNLATSAAEAAKQLSKRVKAWDQLTLIDEVLDAAQLAGEAVRQTAHVHEHAELLSAAYRKARDGVLQEIYDDVKSRFVELYREIHTPDETAFTADIQPTKAGVDFQVDFYGRGTHPPHALHSEGHQDSMGLCLFLALLEGLVGEDIALILLDDVVMSVDSDHRRSLARLFRTAFPDAQFIITTHDRTWANQLRSESVVSSHNLVQFYGWHIDTGPRVLYEGDLWEKIDDSLASNDVASAAHRLRRGAEEYFQSVCDSVRAPVRFSLSGRVDLGDFAAAAIARYLSLIKKAKASANSWTRSEDLSRLADLESTSKQVFERTQTEQWAINENVHFNEWANFTPEELRPVVEAFQDMFDLFRCSSCGSQLRVTTSGLRETEWRCDCAQVSWNLLTKSG